MPLRFKGLSVTVYLYVTVHCYTVTDGCVLLESVQWLPSAHQLHR